jgi:hypothetical protein
VILNLFSFLFSSAPGAQDRTACDGPGVGRSQGQGIAPQALQRHRPCANFAVLDFALAAAQVSFFFIEEKRTVTTDTNCHPTIVFYNKTQAKQNETKQKSIK